MLFVESAEQNGNILGFFIWLFSGFELFSGYSNKRRTSHVAQQELSGCSSVN
jgi:hypothetical protein